MKAKPIFVLVLGVCIITIMTAEAVENKGPSEIVLKGDKAGDVTVSHHKHQNALAGACNLCHNKFSQAPGSIQKLISEGKLKVKEVMQECQACHRQRKEKGEKTGPTAQCSGCHKKKP